MIFDVLNPSDNLEYEILCILTTYPYEELLTRAEIDFFTSIPITHWKILKLLDIILTRRSM